MSEVITYKNTKYQCFCQIKFDSGERILVSIATLPKPSIKIVKLFFGFIPLQTVWEYNPTMAGGYNAYVENLMKMFPPDPNESVEPLDVIRDTLLPCKSIDEARMTLLSCESRVDS
ncbi:MAG: hypothetical protein WA941_23480 [Nitrososphaeraceae archaeon]